MSKIDTRGLSCPTPVLLTKKEVDKGSTNLEILVDNNTAKNNVERFLKKSGFSYATLEDSDNIIIKASK